MSISIYVFMYVSIYVVSLCVSIYVSVSVSISIYVVPIYVSFHVSIYVSIYRRCEHLRQPAGSGAAPSVSQSSSERRVSRTAMPKLSNLGPRSSLPTHPRGATESAAAIPGEAGAGPGAGEGVRAAEPPPSEGCQRV